MQFICNNCNAKYEIPDERIKGKVLKIRCKECGNILELRGDITSSQNVISKIPDKQVDSSLSRKDEGTKSVLQSKFKESFREGKFASTPKKVTFPKQALPREEKKQAEKLLELAHKVETRAAELEEPAIWYVAIKSSPVGPLNKAKIRSYIRKGEVNLSSLVWREGLSNWKPLETIPELEKMFKELEPEIKKPEKIDISARLKRAALQGENIPSPVISKSGSFDNIPQPKGSDTWRGVAGGDEWKGNEAKPFYPDKTEPLEKKPLPEIKTPTEVSKPPAESSSSVIDEAMKSYYLGRAEDGSGSQIASEMRPSYIAEFFSAPLSPVKEETFFQKVLHSRLFLFAGGALALLAGFFIMVGILHFKEAKKKESSKTLAEEKQPSKISQNEEKTEGEEKGDILAGLVITVEEAMAAEEEWAKENQATGEHVAKKSIKKGEKTFKTVVSQMPDIEERSIAESGLKKKITDESAGKESTKNGLSDEQIRDVVTKNSKTIQRCYEKVLGQGMGINEKIRVKVQVKVGTSGKVTKVKVIEITKYGNFLTPCIENGIQTWVFPRAESSSEFIFPILLTPKV